MFYSNTQSQTIVMGEILLHTDNIDTATAEIESAGGRVTMQMGDDLLVAKVPANFITTKKNFESASAHISASASPETLLFVQARAVAYGDIPVKECTIIKSRA